LWQDCFLYPLWSQYLGKNYPMLTHPYLSQLLFRSIKCLHGARINLGLIKLVWFWDDKKVFKLGKCPSPKIDNLYSREYIWSTMQKSKKSDEIYKVMAAYKAFHEFAFWVEYIWNTDWISEECVVYLWMYPPLKTR